jgi:hypothetical protein
MADVLEALERLGGGPVEQEPATLASGFADGRDLADVVHVPQDDVVLNPDDFRPLTDKEWAKLEVYFFATCANRIVHHGCLPGPRPVPWMEHFGNERDIVARLGMLARQDDELKVHIEGAIYKRLGAWGHLLNVDYLLPVAEQQKRGHKRGGRCGAEPFSFVRAEPYGYQKVPRLYSYINGGPPSGNLP